MLRKTCPTCKTNSYSSTNIGPWICPSCKRDIRVVDPHSILLRESKKIQLVQISKYKSLNRLKNERLP